MLVPKLVLGRKKSGKLLHKNKTIEIVVYCNNPHKHSSEMLAIKYVSIRLLFIYVTIGTENRFYLFKNKSLYLTIIFINVNCYNKKKWKKRKSIDNEVNFSSLYLK